MLEQAVQGGVGPFSQNIRLASGNTYALPAAQYVEIDASAWNLHQQSSIAGAVPMWNLTDESSTPCYAVQPPDGLFGTPLRNIYDRYNPPSAPPPPNEPMSSSMAPVPIWDLYKSDQERKIAIRVYRGSIAQLSSQEYQFNELMIVAGRLHLFNSGFPRDLPTFEDIFRDTSNWWVSVYGMNHPAPNVSYSK